MFEKFFKEDVEFKKWQLNSIILIFVFLTTWNIYKLVTNENPNKLLWTAKYFWDYKEKQSYEIHEAVNLVETQGNDHLKFGMNFGEHGIRGKITYIIPQGTEFSKDIKYSTQVAGIDMIKQSNQALDKNIQIDKIENKYGPLLKSPDNKDKMVYGFTKQINYQAELVDGEQADLASLTLNDNSSFSVLLAEDMAKLLDEKVNEKWKFVFSVPRREIDQYELIINPETRLIRFVIDLKAFSKVQELDLLRSVSENFSANFDNANEKVCSHITIFAWGVNVFKFLISTNNENLLNLKKWLEIKDFTPTDKNGKLDINSVMTKPGIHYKNEIHGNYKIQAGFKSWDRHIDERHEKIKHGHTNYLIKMVLTIIGFVGLIIVILYLEINMRGWSEGLEHFIVIAVLALPVTVIYPIYLISNLSYKSFNSIVIDLNNYIKQKAKDKEQAEIVRQEQEEQARLAQEQYEARLIQVEQARAEQEKLIMQTKQNELAGLQQRWQELISWDYKSVLKDKRVKFENRQQIKDNWPEFESIDLDFTIENIPEINSVVCRFNLYKRIADDDLSSFYQFQQAIIRKIADLKSNDKLRLKLIPFRDELDELRKKAQNNDQRIKDLEQINYRVDKIISTVNSK